MLHPIIIIRLNALTRQLSSRENEYFLMLHSIIIIRLNALTRQLSSREKEYSLMLHPIIILRLNALTRQLSSREEEFKQLRDAHFNLQKVREKKIGNLNNQQFIFGSKTTFLII